MSSLALDVLPTDSERLGKCRCDVVTIACGHPSSGLQWSIFFVNADAFQNVCEVEAMTVDESE
jgi:hypothetical protein